MRVFRYDRAESPFGHWRRLLFPQFHGGAPAQILRCSPGQGPKLQKLPLGLPGVRCKSRYRGRLTHIMFHRSERKALLFSMGSQPATQGLRGSEVKSSLFRKKLLTCTSKLHPGKTRNEWNKNSEECACRRWLASHHPPRASRHPSSGNFKCLLQRAPRLVSLWGSTGTLGGAPSSIQMQGRGNCGQSKGRGDQRDSVPARRG